ncbi:MAG: four helix bundle protein [Bacteroidota bacterium]
MPTLKSFEELECWKASREFVNLIFKLTENGRFGRERDSRSQIRRASLSIMNNIAEGFGRISDKEFLRFLDFSQSSGREVKSMLYIFNDLQYLNENQSKELNEHLERTLALTMGLIRYLRKKNS